MTRIYFAYGANMHGGEMAERCPESDFVGPAVLKGYAFRIAKGGFATAVAVEGSVIHGVLWTLSPDDERALDEYEGVPQGLYQKMNVTVDQPDGTQTNAFAYHAVDETAGKPAKGYMEMVLLAARSQGLPEEYVAALSKWMDGLPPT